MSYRFPGNKGSCESLSLQDAETSRIISSLLLPFPWICCSKTRANLSSLGAGLGSLTWMGRNLQINTILPLKKVVDGRSFPMALPHPHSSSVLACQEEMVLPEQPGCSRNGSRGNGANRSQQLRLPPAIPESSLQGRYLDKLDLGFKFKSTISPMGKKYPWWKTFLVRETCLRTIW